MFQDETSMSNFQEQLDMYKEYSEELEKMVRRPLIEYVNGKGYINTDVIIVIQSLENQCANRMDFLGLNAIRKYLTFLSLVAYYGDGCNLYNAEEYHRLVDTEIAIMNMDEALRNLQSNT